MKPFLSYAAAVLLLGAGATTAPEAKAQGTAEDYARAYAARRNFGNHNVFYSDVQARWLPTGDKFWYVRVAPEGRTYTLVDAAARKRAPMFDHSRLAAALSAASGKSVRSDSIVLGRVNVNGGADSVRFEFDGTRWLYLTRTNQLEKQGAVPTFPQRHWMEVDDERTRHPMMSPDGKKEAFMRDDNVWVRDRATGSERRLSIDGTPGHYYSAYIQWSPDSRKIATKRIREAPSKRYVYYVESSPADQVQPKLHKQEYAKPGDELRFQVPCIFDVETGEAIQPDTELFAHQYDISQPKWDADSRAITFEFNERGHKHYRVLEVSAQTGSVRPLIDEAAETYVHYPRNMRHDLSDGRRIIWFSERDNYGHLYMYDRTTGQPTHQITRGPWYVRSIEKVDEKAGKIYFSANGVRTDEDPYNIRYYSINFDGSGMTDLTPTPGHHAAVLSPDARYIVDVVSTPADAPVATLRSAVDGKELMHIETADISRLLANGWQAPEVFSAPGRDGKTMMWGIIQKPSNFDPSKKYPVIEYIYQGPHSHFVPKNFMAYNYYMQHLAELGFVVVMVDGMSTSFRSREFENVAYKNLKDAGIPDHIAWLKAAAEAHPYLDIDRVGIYGMSAGGQESLSAILHHPEMYKACYSSAGCHDNRMDKIWWNELWMGYPVDEAYDESSNVVNAHLLQRPLMLVVGEIDDNVDPASTMQVADALMKANRDFELIVVPGARHTMGERFGEHKRYDFFVRHLMGV